MTSIEPVSIPGRPGSGFGADDCDYGARIG